MSRLARGMAFQARGRRMRKQLPGHELLLRGQRVRLWSDIRLGLCAEGGEEAQQLADFSRGEIDAIQFSALVDELLAGNLKYLWNDE